MASKDFFLSPDDAQTLGNINYMRKSVRVRHTFPKNLKNPNGFEIVKEVSSSEGQVVDQFQNINRQSSMSQPNWTNNMTQNNNSSQSTLSNSNTTNAGTSLNMFRNMARSLRRK